MPLMIPLIFLLLFELGKTCSSERDSSIKQKIYYRGQCKCREYVDTYATCYYFRCENFPKYYKTTLPCFKLQATGMTEILSGDFEHLSHLTRLYIEDNMMLKTIQPGALKDLSKLVTLSISFNPLLTNLDEEVFKGLYSLETLRLTRNGFNEIKDFSMAFKANYLPKLITIKLEELECPKVEEHDFINLKGSQIENLLFDGSLINYIHPNAFIHLKHLKNLSVSETLIEEDNMIDVLIKINEEKIPLTSLNLQGWGFKIHVPNKLFNVIANMTITELILNRNQFHSIDSSTFPNMPYIEKLILEESMITDIKENAFINLPKLKQLHLKGNKLVAAPKGALIPTLEYLDMSRNGKPGVSYLIISEQYWKRFVNMSSLIVLDLSYNNVRRIYGRSINGLINLKILNLYRSTLAVIQDYAFIDLISLEYLNLGDNPFPQRSFSKNTFFGLIKLKYLSLESCKIDYLPSNDIFVHLTSLEVLNLKKNFITEITPQFIFSIRTLKVLNFDENKLKVWHERLFIKTAMENFTASRNTFPYLTKAMLDDFSGFKMVDVSNNPFHCECDSLIESFNSLSYTKATYILDLLTQKSTFCLLPETEGDITIVNYYLNNYKLCKRDKIIKLLRYLLPSLICLIIILTITILSYIYRWHIRYWIFLTKLAVSRTQFKKISIKTHSNYVYDAFVSYSTEDRDFVINLVDMLEKNEPFLKLCVYERDFELGTIISESVLECLSRSRKTLLIISNSYIKSQWCIWEAQVAENQRLFFENEDGECVNDSLIMIKLGNISSKNISPMLKYLMKTRIYLQWDPADKKQKQFWEKLRNALTPSINTEDEINSPDDNS